MEDDLKIPFGENAGKDGVREDPPEERIPDEQAGNDLIPEGFHDAIVLDVKGFISKQNKPCYQWTLNFPKAEKVLDRIFTTAVKGKTSKGGPIAWLLKQALEACNIDVHATGGSLKKAQVVGKKVRVKIEHEANTFSNSDMVEKVVRFESPVKKKR